MNIQTLAFKRRHPRFERALPTNWYDYTVPIFFALKRSYLQVVWTSQFGQICTTSIEKQIVSQVQINMKILLFGFPQFSMLKKFRKNIIRTQITCNKVKYFTTHISYNSVINLKQDRSRSLYRDNLLVKRSKPTVCFAHMGINP